jgi:GST-like protein
MLTRFGTNGSGSAAVDRGPGSTTAGVEAASWQASPGLDELRRINPVAQIPTLLRDNGSVMTGSAAILIQLGFAYPDSRLLAPEASRHAKQIRGLVHVAANLTVRVSRLLVLHASRRELW